MARVIGGKERAANLRKLAGPEMIRRVGAALFAGGELIEIEAEHSIIEGSVTGKGHVRSAPGEAPNQEWGTLANNIETVQVAPLRVEVSSNAPYSAALEYGTSKMAERPFMRPAVAKRRKEVTALVRRAVSSVVQSSKGP